MFKWFAPLLLFAGKPELVARLVTFAAAGAVLAFGVWLISRVALTFDALKNPYIVAIYGVVLFCFFLGVGAVAWLRLRRVGRSERVIRPGPAPEKPLAQEVVVKRAEQIARKWDRGSRRQAGQVPDAAGLQPAAVPPAPLPQHANEARANLMVTGPAHVGKTALIAALVRATSASAAETSDIVRLVDAGPVDGDAEHLASLIARAASADGALFVVDQDLRAPEVAAIRGFIATGKPLYIVLNKADQLNAADRDTILVSIRAKMPEKFIPSHVVAVAGAPSPIEREIEDARGAVRLELRRPSSDMQALTNLLSRAFPPRAGRTPRFEAG